MASLSLDPLIAYARVTNSHLKAEDAPGSTQRVLMDLRAVSTRALVPTNPATRERPQVIVAQHVPAWPSVTWLDLNYPAVRD